MSTSTPPADSEPITVTSSSLPSNSQKEQERANIQAQLEAQKAEAARLYEASRQSHSKVASHRYKAAENQVQYLTSKLDHFDDPVVAKPTIAEILSQRERTYGYTGSQHNLKDKELKKAKSEYDSAQKALNRAKYYYQNERLRERDPWEYEQKVQAAERELSIAKAWYGFVSDTAMPKVKAISVAQRESKAAEAANLKPKYGEESAFNEEIYEQVVEKEKAERAEERREEREGEFAAYRRADAAAEGRLTGASFTDMGMQTRSEEDQTPLPRTGKDTAVYFDDLTKDAMPAPTSGTVDYYKEQIKQSAEAEKQFREGTAEFTVDDKTFELSPQALQTARMEAVNELAKSGKPTKVDSNAIDQKTAELLETQYMEQGIPVEPDRKVKAEQTNVAYAAFKANQIVDSLNQGKQSALGLSDFDVKLLDKYDENKARTGKSQAREIRELQSAMVKEQKATARAGKVDFGMDTVPGPKPGQSDKAWLKDLEQQGYKVVGTTKKGSQTQYQFRNIKEEADLLTQAYQDAGYVKTNVKIGKVEGPVTDDIVQSQKVFEGRPYTEVQVNLPSGERKEYIFESKEVLRESARRAKALEGGFGAGFANVFLDMGSTVKFYAADVPAKFVLSGGNSKETVDLLVKGPKLNPSLFGDAIGAPITAGIDSAQGKGDFGKLASENLARYGQEVSDPRYRDYYAGQAAGEVAFGVATLGIAPAIKAIQAGLKTTPALIKAGAEAARIVGIESKITSAKPIIITASKEKGIIDETLDIGRFGLTYGRGKIGGATINIGTKQAPRSINIPQRSFKVPKIPNAYELVSESGKVRVGKGERWFKREYAPDMVETITTYIPKTREFIPATGQLSRSEIDAVMGKDYVEVVAFGPDLSKIGLAQGLLSLERKAGQTFATSATVIARKPESMLPKISLEVEDASSKSASSAFERATSIFTRGATKAKGQQAPRSLAEAEFQAILDERGYYKQIGGYIKETGEVLLPSGKRVKLGLDEYLDVMGGELRITHKAPTYLTFSEKELRRGLREQETLAAKRRSTREALLEASQAETNTARSKNLRKRPTSSSRPERTRLIAATSERLTTQSSKSPLSYLLERLSSAELAKSIGGYSTGGRDTLYVEKGMFGFGGQSGFERLSRKKQSDYDYSYLRYPEGSPIDSSFQLTENVKDLNALASGLSGFEPLSGGSKNVVPSDFGTIERDLFGLETGIGPRVGFDLNTGIGVKPSQRMRAEQRAAQQEGFQFRYDLDVDLGHSHVTRQQTRAVTDPFLEEITTRNPPGIPRLPWDFGIPNISASDGKRSRRKNRAWEVPDVLALSLGKSAQGVLGYGIDDYSQALMEEYGGSLSGRSIRRRRK